MEAPLTIADARARRLSWDQLQSRRWQRLACGVYSSSNRDATPMLVIAAASRRLPVESVFSGATAAWLHGLDVAPVPIEVTVPAGHAASHRAGMRFHKARLDASEAVTRHGFRVTSVRRTLADLAASSTLTEAVVAVDMALHAGLVTLPDLVDYSSSLAGRKGTSRFRRALSLADVAESAMESRLRLLLVLSGLPAPCPQVDLFSESGEHLARVDLYYASHRLCIEFDGGNHRDRLVADDRRQNRLVHAGYTVLRFTTADLAGSPQRIVALIRGILSSPPHPDFSRNQAAARLQVPDFGRNQARRVVGR